MTSRSQEKACLKALEHLCGQIEGPLPLMEVCGTHTVAIARNALKQVLPPQIHLLSGPGCPVCVTHQSDINRALEAAEDPGWIVATYGDMLRVPGKSTSLLEARARGSAVEVVTSAMESLELAEKHPEKKVLFLGVGFETTAPATAATLLEARKRKAANFFVLSLHKEVPPVLRYLGEQADLPLRGFLLPGHVATVLGEAPFTFLAEDFGLAAAVAGFELKDILLGLVELLRQIAANRPEVRNVYSRGVRHDGNPKARSLMRRVFRPGPALWRGLGLLENSGLLLREEFAPLDARSELGLPEDAEQEGDEENPLCRCGEVLMGRAAPGECSLFGKACTPAHPLGPCMVSREGSCAAAWKYEKSVLSGGRS